jgi:ubiquinone/menaquinone biosynthesis C-methylase UbiE
MLWLFESRKTILDFGSGTGANIALLAQKLTNKCFTLVDHSEEALKCAQQMLRADVNNNLFRYCSSLDKVETESQQLVMAIQVLEHITDYRGVLGELWRVLRKEGVLLISVPVKGRRDWHHEHVNKFTIDSMFKILKNFSEWVHISARSYSKRSGILSTAYFYVEKEK